MDNKFNEVFSSFAPLYSEFSPSHKVIDIFPSCFSFHLFNKQKDNSFKTYIQQLDNLVIKSSSTPLHALVIIDASIKNNVTTFISYIHIHNKSVTKTLHHMANVTSTEAKLFTIRCGINQTTSYNSVSKIFVITDSIHSAKKILNPASNPYQIYISSILKKLRTFFSCHQENSIKFWKYSSYYNWTLHKAVDKEIKSFNPTLLFPCKVSCNFSKRSECDNIANKQKITFQVSNLKRKYFFDLLNSDNNIIKLSYIKGGSWLKFFGYSNSLCARASRAITNYAPIGEYRLRFFPRKEFRCLCGLYPIETRCHILHECRRFDKY